MYLRNPRGLAYEFERLALLGNKDNWIIISYTVVFRLHILPSFLFFVFFFLFVFFDQGSATWRQYHHRSQCFWAQLNIFYSSDAHTSQNSARESYEYALANTEQLNNYRNHVKASPHHPLPPFSKTYVCLMHVSTHTTLDGLLLSLSARSKKT